MSYFFYIPKINDLLWVVIKSIKKYIYFLNQLKSELKSTSCVIKREMGV